jgi:hypothetical protein
LRSLRGYGNHHISGLNDRSRPLRLDEQRGNQMRLFVAALIVTAALYYWDQNYNHGSLFDGLDSMTRSIAHSFFP